MELTDSQLLGLYLDKQSQAAFAELVDRHGGLVYYAALRRVGGDRQLAEDISQSVFADLARKASFLRNRAVLAGWLYTSTRFAAADAVRSERRRRTREQAAETMKDLDSAPTADWKQLRPVIDDAMDELSEQDREAVLLRYFEDCSFAEVGERFALSADAARMRIERALDKLQGALTRRGIASTSASLAIAIGSQSGLAAPVGLTGKIVSGVLAKSAPSAATVLGGWKILACAAVGALAVGLVLIKESQPDKAGVTQPDPNAPSANGAPAPGALQASGSLTGNPAPTAAPDRSAPPPGNGNLASLSAFQRSLLKRLWTIERLHPTDLNVHWGVVMGPGFNSSAAMQADVASLQTEGLIAIGQKRGVIFLTASGIAFCSAHSGELDALQPGTRGGGA